jgi:hypothetical protein
MGIKYAHQLTYGINDITLHDLYKIAIARIPVDNDNRAIRQRPCIDIDCSLLVRTRGNNNLVSNTTYIINVCRIFQHVGFDVMVVFDGVVRHHSKRTTIQRQSECDRKRVEIIIHKSSLMNIIQQRRTVDSIEERNKLLLEEADIKKKIKTIERVIQQTTIDVGEKLFKNFSKQLEKLTNNNNIWCCQALFQADSVMAGRIISGKTDILLTSDSDQAALLGEQCVSVKKLNLNPVNDQQ